MTQAAILPTPGCTLPDPLPLLLPRQDDQAPKKPEVGPDPLGGRYGTEAAEGMSAYQQPRPMQAGEGVVKEAQRLGAEAARQGELARGMVEPPDMTAAGSSGGVRVPLRNNSVDVVCLTPPPGCRPQQGWPGRRNAQAGRHWQGPAGGAVRQRERHEHVGQQVKGWPGVKGGRGWPADQPSLT